MKYTFTVFTATYNRFELLKNVYYGLCNQVFKDFEWIIIDDGSTDNTSELVGVFREEAIIKIKYVYKKNAGKHLAYLSALDLAEGRFFLPLDSDDIPLPNALHDLYEAYMTIPDEEKNKFSAVTGLCVDKSNAIIGDIFPKDVFDSSPLDLSFIYKVSGDKWGFQKTEIRRNYTFPIAPDERFKEAMKFYPEISIFGEIGRMYKTRYINKPLKIVQYHKTGLSQSKIPHAYAKKLSALYRLNYCYDYFRYAPYEFTITLILYNRWSLHSSSLNYSEIKPKYFKFLSIILLPLSYAIYCIDKLLKK